jgi:lysozyme family protein
MTETEERRHAMGKAIVEFEGRYSAGKLQCYRLPVGDGGGAYEIAGINDRYHPTKAGQLKSLIDSGQHEKAEAEAAAYITEYTKGVLKFFPSQEAAEDNPAIEFVLRDTAFNRGAKGAAAVLQIALGMQHIDGIVGSATHREFAKQLADPGPAALLLTLTQARETYERTSYNWKAGKRDEASKFWKGLSSRWAKAHTVASTRFA